MTAPDPRLNEIQARVDAATPGPWETMRSGLLGTRVVRVDGEWDGLIPDEFVTLVTPALRIYCDADLIANAPADLAFLLAELRKAHEALERVEALHKRVEGYQFGAIPGAEPDWPVCSTCFTEDEHPQPWPCPTAAAVAAAKGDGE